MSIDHLEKDVSHFTIKSFIYSFSRGQKLTFVDKENQSQVSKLLDRFLDTSTQPVCSVFSPGLSNKNLPDQSAIDQLVQYRVGHIENEENPSSISTVVIPGSS